MDSKDCVIQIFRCRFISFILISFTTSAGCQSWRCSQKKARLFFFSYIKGLVGILFCKAFFYVGLGYLFMDELSSAVAQFYPGGLSGGSGGQEPPLPDDHWNLPGLWQEPEGEGEGGPFPENHEQIREVRETRISLKSTILETSNMRAEIDRVERKWPGITHQLSPSTALDRAIEERITVAKGVPAGIHDGASLSELRAYREWVKRMLKGTDSTLFFSTLGETRGNKNPIDMSELFFFDI